MILKPTMHTRKINELDAIHFKNICTTRDPVKVDRKRYVKDWENIFANHRSIKTSSWRNLVHWTTTHQYENELLIQVHTVWSFNMLKITEQWNDQHGGFPGTKVECGRGICQYKRKQEKRAFVEMVMVIQIYMWKKTA